MQLENPVGPGRYHGAADRGAWQSFAATTRWAAAHLGPETAGRTRGAAEWSIALLVGVGVAVVVVVAHILGLDSPADGDATRRSSSSACSPSPS